MKYTVLMSRQAEKFYKKLQGNIKTQIRENLLDLENQRYSGKRLHGNLKDRNSIRAGKLRIIYRVLEKDKAVYVIAIGPRETIYQ